MSLAGEQVAPTLAVATSKLAPPAEAEALLVCAMSTQMTGQSQSAGDNTRRQGRMDAWRRLCPGAAREAGPGAL